MSIAMPSTARREFAHDGDTISYPVGRVTVHLTRRASDDFYLVVTDHTGLAVAGKDTFSDEKTARTEARQAVHTFRADAESPAQVVARVTKTAPAVVTPAAPAPVEYGPVVWPERARAGTRLWVSEPGLAVLLLAMDRGGWANSVREFGVKTVTPLLDRGMVTAMQTVTRGELSGRQLDPTNMNVVITRKGWAVALSELASMLRDGTPTQQDRFGKYAHLLEALAVNA